jgi:hypothetical protein
VAWGGPVNFFFNKLFPFWTKHLGKFWRNMFLLVLNWLFLLFLGKKSPFFNHKIEKKNSRVKVILALGLTLLTHPHFLATHKVPQSENHSVKLRMNSQIGFFSNQVSLSFISHLFMFSRAFLHITYRAINQELHHFPPSTHKRRRIKWLVSNSTSFFG